MTLTSLIGKVTRLETKKLPKNPMSNVTVMSSAKAAKLWKKALPGAVGMEEVAAEPRRPADPMDGGCTPAASETLWAFLESPCHGRIVRIFNA
jgi:hypothetical protein